METMTVMPIFAEGDAEFFFPIVVLAIIFFIQWLAHKAKESSHRPTPSFDRLEDEMEERPYAHQPPTPPPAKRSPSSPLPPPGSPGDELRRLLESLRDQPPAPGTSPKEPFPRKKKQNPPPPPITPALPPKVAPAAKQAPASMPPKARPRPLRLTPQSIREAVILKEVLDPPKALRDDW